MITKKQFDNLSIYALGWHLINFKYTIEVTPDGLKLYANQSNFDNLRRYPRLRHLKKYEYESIEMMRMDVPKTDPLYEIILNLCSKYILEDEPVNEPPQFFEK